MASIQTPVLSSAALRDEYANHLSIVLAEIENAAESTEAGFAGIGDLAESTTFDSAYVRQLVSSLISAGLAQESGNDDDTYMVGGYPEDVWERMAETTAWLTAPETRAEVPATAPKAPKPKPAGNDCYCGCGAQTASAKSLYRPGHDARHAGEVARQLIATDGELPAQKDLLASLPTDKLRAKALGIANATSRRTEKAAARAEATAVRREAQAAEREAKREAKAAREAAKEEPVYTMGEIKTGRWTYPARRDLAGIVERNENRQGTGEWKAADPTDAKAFRATA